MQSVTITGDGQKIPAQSYGGFSVSAVAAATVTLFDGTPSGTVLETLLIPAGTSQNNFYPQGGVGVVNRQIWVAVTGSPVGCIRTI